MNVSELFKVAEGWISQVSPLRTQFIDSYCYHIFFSGREPGHD